MHANSFKTHQETEKYAMRKKHLIRKNFVCKGTGKYCVSNTRKKAVANGI